MEKVDFVIVGGGAAGLGAARRLLEKGACPLLLESGNYPAHKVCGEFFSPVSLPLLQRWDIHLQPIEAMHWHTASRSLSFTFPSPAGSLSHLSFDPQLAKQVVSLGGQLWTQARVENLQPANSSRDWHILNLACGKIIGAKHLLIATGRLPHQSASKPTFAYKGFKAHFKGFKLNKTLEMFSVKGAYLGLCPLENGMVNLACLATMQAVDSFSACDFMQKVVQIHPFLCEQMTLATPLFDEWMEASVPEFGRRVTPNWPRAYFIGDAAATIPPACGGGLSLALASGYLAAEFALRDDAAGFKSFWQKKCKWPLFFAKGLHALFLHPAWGQRAALLAQHFPFLAKHAFDLTCPPSI